MVTEFIGLNANVNPFKFVSMSYHECKTRPEIMNIKSNELLFYPYSVLANKCSGICNDINNPCTKSWVPDLIKNINIKVFNLISRTTETRHMSWHKTCACKYRLNTCVCNDKQY